MRAKGIYLLYRALQIVASPAILLYFALRAVRDARYRAAFFERMGKIAPQVQETAPGCIWLHAVSVGEIIASIALIRRLQADMPGVPIYVSAGTTAGRAMAGEKLAGLAAGIFYAPIDYVFAVRRTLRALRPSVLVVLETEIWPNLFREARRYGAAVAIVNGRISDRTVRRYARMKWFFGTVLAQVDRILAQSEKDRERFLAAGAPPEIVEAAGNLKYDFEPREGKLDFAQGHPLWIAASTTADDRIAEEDAVLDAQAQLSGWRLILAPRKPDRFEEVARKLAARNVRFVRRTQMDGMNGDAEVLLLDTIGELAGLFARADVVFMGGTLADRGGHNILEPAFFGKPIITGPHLENFRDIGADFRSHEAVMTIERPEELAQAVRAAAKDRQIGERARSRAAAHRGATAHAVRAIRELREIALPQPRPNLTARIAFAPLEWLWRAGGERKARRALRDQRSLDVPVISVGNITTGGTGKTPFVAWLARRARAEGFRPGILTRGYGRRSHEKIFTAAAGSTATVYQTGDEAQILLRRGDADLGVSADRYASGMMLRERYADDLFLLDDGFQHRKLKRDLDIVLIDALNPFGNGELMPLGRLREPLPALGRADVFVITRSERSRILPAIERRLRLYQPNAPIFLASTVARQWFDCETGQEVQIGEMAGERIIAFCGLGNPGAFWQLLERIGIKPVDLIEYSDHHAYTPSELRRMAQYAKERKVSLLLATEKDVVNLCEGVMSLLAGLRLLWVKIDLEIDDEAGMLNLLREVKAGSK